MTCESVRMYNSACFTITLWFRQTVYVVANGLGVREDNTALNRDHSD